MPSPRPPPPAPAAAGASLSKPPQAAAAAAAAAASAPLTIGDETSLCIECGRAAGAGLYREFSKDNIRLSRCPSCGAVADRLIECEMVLVGLDLALNRLPAWRHLLFNRPPHCQVGWRQLLRMATVLIILDIHVKYATYVNTTTTISSTTDPSITDTANYQLSLLLRILLLSMLEHLLFIGAVAGLAARWLATLQQTTTRKPTMTSSVVTQKLVQALLYPNFGRLLVVFVMVWEPSVSVGNLITLLVLSAQWVAVRTVVEAAVALNEKDKNDGKKEGEEGMGSVTTIEAVALPFVVGLALKGLARLVAYRMDAACTNLYLL